MAADLINLTRQKRYLPKKTINRKKKKVITIEFSRQRLTRFIAFAVSLGSIMAMSYLSVSTVPKMEYKLMNTPYTLKSSGVNRRAIKGENIKGRIWAIVVPPIKKAVLLKKSDLLNKLMNLRMNIAKRSSLRCRLFRNR